MLLKCSPQDHPTTERAATSTTVSRLQLTSSTSKSFGSCYLSKMNNKLWQPKNTGMTSSDTKWPFSRLLCHLCISDTGPFAEIWDQGGAQLVASELSWHLLSWMRSLQRSRIGFGVPAIPAAPAFFSWFIPWSMDALIWSRHNHNSWCQCVCSM